MLRVASMKASQGWQIIRCPRIQIAYPFQEVFLIPKERDRVIVKACELTPQQAATVCQTLLQHLTGTSTGPRT